MRLTACPYLFRDTLGPWAPLWLVNIKTSAGRLIYLPSCPVYVYICMLKVLNVYYRLVL